MKRLRLIASEDVWREMQALQPKMLRITGFLLLISMIVLFGIKESVMVLAGEQDVYDALSFSKTYQRCLRVFKKIEVLGKEGMNVTGLITEYNVALEYLEENTSQSLMVANKILNDVEKRADNMLAQLSHFTMMQKLKRYTVIAVLLSIPVLSYFLIPWICYEIWYRSRRNWMVEKK